MATAGDTGRGTTGGLLRLLPDAGRGLVGALVAVTAVQSAHPLAVIATTGVLVGRAVSRPGIAAVAVPLAVLAGLFGLQQFLGPAQGVLRYRATSRIDGAMAAPTMEAAGRPAGVEVIEDPEVQDLITADEDCAFACNDACTPQSCRTVGFRSAAAPEQFLDHLFRADDPAAARLLRLGTDMDRRR